ncbi:LysM-like peptidoglycan-binding domain-containing protein [Proteus mirabilis]|uniref:LysM-like peptidoglycan-binding domain-containing protein n=1 Tax=Proteus mirabilis TaxID=584 RepID=UPI0034D655F7
MVRASMATRNKKEVTISDSDSQFNHEVNMGKFPGLHRRAIVIIAIILLVVFLWPTSENTTPPQPSSSTQDLPVPISPSVSNETQNVPNTLPPAQDSLSAEQETEGLPEEGEANNTNENTPVNTTSQAPSTVTENWQTYTIKEGQTLAQLFRDNQLLVNDAFTMAKSEGPQKPLSQLRSGQTIRLQRGAQGEVSMLEVTDNTGTVITFTRLSDGSYYRTP